MRLAEWRNHIHQYEGDNEFYLGSAPTTTRPVVAEMNVINANNGEKNGTAFVPAEMITPFAYGNTHLGCHNAYIFEPADTCFASFGPSTSCNNNVIGTSSTNAAAIALVKEKLKTIEESNSEENLLDSSIVGTVTTSSGSPGTTCLTTGCTCKQSNMSKMFGTSLECNDHEHKTCAKNNEENKVDEDDKNEHNKTSIVIEKQTDSEKSNSETKC